MGIFGAHCPCSAAACDPAGSSAVPKTHSESLKQRKASHTGINHTDAEHDRKDAIGDKMDDTALVRAESVLQAFQFRELVIVGGAQVKRINPEKHRGDADSDSCSVHQQLLF